MHNFKREGFINQYPPLNVLNKKETNLLYQKDNIHLYVHIPFCKTKCDFCYYLSFAIANGNIPDTYVEAIISEINLYAQMPQIQSKQVQTIYFGGGTPSLLSIKQWELLMNTIYEKFDVSNCQEICVEVGPEAHISVDKLLLLKKLGITRISIGCQSTDDNVLRVNGRHCTSNQFYLTYDKVREVGFDVINVDIMSGLIGQSTQSFLETIDNIIELQPQNISIYKLEIYLNNILYRKFRDGKLIIGSDDEEIQQVRKGYKRLLENGYILANHFSFYKNEIYEHIHRKEVWKGANMLGIGVSAHSNVDGILYQNEAAIDSYYDSLQKGKLPIRRCHKMTFQEKLLQRIILGIKNLYIDRNEIITQYGADPFFLYEELFRWAQDNEILTLDNSVIRLTHEGALFADDFAKLFYLPEHRSMSLAHIERPNNRERG